MKLSRKVYLALFSLMMFTGVGASISQQSAHASQVTTTAISKKNSQKQQANQNKSNSTNNNVAKQANNKKAKNNWFRDGLSNKNLAARSWVTYRESNHHWNVSNGRCYGYFQLSAGYLGYKHGHVNLDHKHQVKVGDHYATSRYGSWVGAKKFWRTHGWY